MARLSTTATYGTIATGTYFASPRGETVEVALTLLASPGVPHDGAGRGSVRLCVRPTGSTVAPTYDEQPGNALGEYLLTIPATLARFWNALQDYDLWWVPTAGDPIQIQATANLSISGAIGPAGYGVHDDTTDPLEDAPFRQTIELAVHIDRAGSTAGIATAPAYRLPYGGGTHFRLTTTDLQGDDADPSASGAVYLTRNGVQIGTTVTLAQVVGSPGVFTGSIGVANQLALGVGAVFDWCAFLIVGGEPFAAVMPSPACYVATGRPLNVGPTAAILTPASAVTMAAGNLALTFEASDDSALGVARCAVVVDGVVTADAITITDGEGTTAIEGSASVALAAGVHVVGIRVTDTHGAIATPTIDATAYALAITSPPAGTYDEGTFDVTVTATPAVPSGTVLTVYSGETLVGTGTVGAGLTTSSLTDGSRSLTARMVIAGLTVTSPAVVLTIADQDPTVAITSPANGAQLGAGDVVVTFEIDHPTADPADLTGQVSLNNATWAAATHVSGNDWAATVSVTSDPTTIYARGYDATPGGSVVAATPITVNASLTATVTGATWASICETDNAAALTFTCTETAESTTDLTPAFIFAGAATRHIVATASTSLSDVTALVVGHLNTFDQHPVYSIGTAYNLAQQSVTGIANLGLLTGLEIFACYANPITAIDLSNCTSLQYVEAGMCTALTSLLLPSSASFIRCCIEQSSLTTIDLEPVAPYIYDLRAAAQQGGALHIDHGGVIFARLDHWCTRDEDVTFDQAMNWPTQLPVVREIWCWNCGLTGAFAPRSTALASVQAYNNGFTSADFTNQFPAGRACELLFADNPLTGGIVLTGCNGLATINLQDCGLTRAQVDSVLTTINGWGTSNVTVVIDGTNLPPTATGEAAAQAIEARGGEVTRNPYAGGVDVDEFATELGEGWTSLLGDATAVWSAANGGCMVRTENNGYCVLGNPGALVTANADYEVQTEVTAATKAAGFFGIVGRWTGSTGVRLLWLAVGDPTVGNANGYAAGNISLQTDAAFPASWSNTGVASTLRMRMVGTTISIYCDGVLVRHGTLATNATATGTYYGNCGEGGSNHVYNRMAVVTV